MRSLAFLLCMICGSALSVFGQDTAKAAPLQLGVGLTANSYLGDLNYRDDSPLRAYPGINFSLQFDNKKAFGLQVNSGFARITEQNDAAALDGVGEYNPNRFVQTSFFYLDLRLRRYFLRKQKIKPFLAAGIGFVSFNPEDVEGNFLLENIFTRLPEEENYLTLVAQFPMQAGIQIQLNPTMYLNLSGVYRFVSSDYVDNISAFGRRGGNDALLSAQAELLFSIVGKEKEPTPVQPKEEPAPFIVKTYDFLMLWEEGEKKDLTLQVEPVDYPKSEKQIDR